MRTSLLLVLLTTVTVSKCTPFTHNTTIITALLSARDAPLPTTIFAENIESGVATAKATFPADPAGPGQGQGPVWGDPIPHDPEPDADIELQCPGGTATVTATVTVMGSVNGTPEQHGGGGGDSDSDTNGVGELENGNVGGGVTGGGGELEAGPTTARKGGIAGVSGGDWGATASVRPMVTFGG